MVRGRGRAGWLLAAALCSAAPAGAAVWDLYGGAGLSAGRADNPRFSSTQRLRAICDPASPPSVYDPNNPLCDPNDPSYDPQVSSPASSRRGDVTGSLRLTGGVKAAWAQTQFDLVYSPTAGFYYSNPDLNQVGHTLASTWRHAYSPRASMALDASVNYTPEQDLDPNNVRQNTVLVNRTSRTFANFRGSYGLELGRRTGMSWTYRFTLRSFSSEDLVDSRNHNAGVSWRHRLTERHSFNHSYEYGVHSFNNTDPNVTFETGSQTYSGSVGYGYDSPRGLNLSLNVGYNTLSPSDPNADSTSGLFVNSALGWSGTRLGAAAGYSRAFTDGGGAFGDATSHNAHANLRWSMSKRVSSDFAATRNVTQRAGVSASGASQDDSVTSLNGRATLNYTFAENWGLNAGYSHHRQRQPGAGAGVPEIRSNRYSLGLSWSIP